MGCTGINNFSRIASLSSDYEILNKAEILNNVLNKMILILRLNSKLIEYSL